MAKRWPATRWSKVVLAAFAAAGVAAGMAEAREQLVQMLTEGEHGRFQMEPAILVIAPGDRVRFRPGTRLHAAKSIAGMQPKGAPRWWGRMGEEILVRFDQPGVYGFKCPAHYEVGMVGLIVVGQEPANWQAAKAVRHPPMAAEAFQRLFAEAACRLGPAYRADCRR